MQRWSLKVFVEQYGEWKASKIWGKTQQAVNRAVKSDRVIYVAFTSNSGGEYSMHESKRLGGISAKDLKKKEKTQKKKEILKKHYKE